jgi:hypothetical protein
MKRLAAKISDDLEAFNESYVYNSELARVWPANMPPREREKAIREFAKRQGLDVDVYLIGMCAIFKKPPAKRAGRVRPKRARRVSKRARRR